ncbi:hypothetical protein BGLA2_310075 [Burkholderia gladioli]|nr:hypothetical protein BGLA2_310075 [Burkholderia gladioli]
MAFTLASIAWRFDALVDALSGLSGVVVQPVSARLPTMSAAAAFNTRLRFCIVFLLLHQVWS